MWLVDHAQIQTELEFRAMAHDEAVYPNPDEFKPERYLDKNGCLNDNERVLAFGFGRRSAGIGVEVRPSIR